MPEQVKLSKGYGKERILGEAVDFAREALSQLTKPANVGAHVGVVAEGDRVLTHCFACLLPGYPGWYWTVTLARIPRSKRPTINEMSLRPGKDAHLAPDWVPWAERLQPDDIQPTDRLPYVESDERLEPGFEEIGDDADQLEQFEMGLGRERVLSPEGRSQAFSRWYANDHGPDNPATRSASATCSTCGFLMTMGGSARTVFGVCANEWSPFDGKVVSFDHGCGSHSQTDVPKQKLLWDPVEPVIDEMDVDVLAAE
ncbi:MAG: DUF3027 domain-containing protein [Ancrocorticia sp.]|uniref:DUF3027 domain-containing protein n=1 Tax=Ancrocorticia sp. TaxID=2593684 RepID=UPI003F8E1687